METWTLTWTKLAALDDKSVKDIPDGIPGVYRLSYKDGDGNYYVFYVGKADDIKVRLQEHLSRSEQNVRIKNYIEVKKCFFRYAKATKDYIRSSAERQMYRQFEPPCNDKEPEGRDDVKVNLT